MRTARRDARRGPLFPGLAAALALFIAFSARGHAQSMEDQIRQLGIREFATGYLEPGAEAVGTTLNSGLFQTARVRKGFHIRVGVNVIWAFIPEDRTTFTADLPSSLIAQGYPASITSASIFGGKGSTISSTRLQPTGQPYPDVKLPDGLSMRNVFFAMPQVSVGSIMASEILVRGLPPVTYEPALGKISFFGVGLRHSPSQYFRHMPFDLSLMAYAQTFKVSDLFDVQTQSYSAIISKSLRVMTVFGGISYESYDVHVTYNYVPVGNNIPPQYRSPQLIDLQFTKHSWRYTAGATLYLIPFVDVSAAYSFGDHACLSFGAGIGF